MDDNMKEEDENLDVHDLAPDLPRYSLRVMLSPPDPGDVTLDKLITCLEGVSIRSGGLIIAGPFAFGKDEIKGVDETYVHPEVNFRDLQAMNFYTDAKAKYVKHISPFTAGILENSHGVIYYFPEHNLIDIFIETCMKFEPEKVYSFLDVFWQPDENKIQSIYSQITSGNKVKTFPKARKIISGLYSIIENNKEDKSIDEILKDGELLETSILKWNKSELGELENYFTDDQKEVLWDVYAQYEGQLEQIAANKVISGEVDHEKVFPFYDRYKRLTEREIDKAEIGPRTKVAFIGGGWFPISAILYARTGANVKVIEKDEYRASISSKVVEKLNLSENIEIVCKEAEALRYDEYKFDTISIAAMAKPKEKILSRINFSFGYHQNILIRTTSKEKRFLFEELKQYCNILPYDSYEAKDSDDILSFIVAFRRPHDLYGDDKRVWKEDKADLLVKHENYVFGNN